MNMPIGSLEVFADPKIAKIKVTGRATMKVSDSLKDFGLKVIENGVEKIIIYFDDCEGMDSTFMGILTMISLTGRQQTTRVEIVIANAANSLTRLLIELGLKQMFTFENDDASSDNFQNIGESKTSMDEQKKTILDAHQTLSDVNEDNQEEFKDVIAFLKDEN